MKQCANCLATFEDAIDQCPDDKCSLQSTEVDIDPLIGTALAERYKILAVLGSGGMGTVYKAQHLSMDRIVAVKVLHAHLAQRANALRRFHEEAKTIAQLKHHNIITLYDFGISPHNQPFLVMDYIDGFSLKKYVEKNGSVPLEAIGPILKQVVDGLAYAHSENVVHRDLKPENIMLTQNGSGNYKVTLVDFGLAILTSESNNSAAPAATQSRLLGSPFYMSPEQCLTSGTVDNRTDIYSLAVVLYEALSGRLPYEKRAGIAMMESHLRKQPIPFNLTQPGFKVCSELARVFNQALAKEPDSRYQSIGDFGTDLEEALQRDAVKWKAIRHRAMVARQTMTNSGSVIDQETFSQEILDENALDLQFQTGTKFLSRQAEIEAATTKDTNAGEAKQCIYCGAMVPAGIQFCLSCQRKIRSRPSKMSETYSGLAMPPSDSNGHELSRQAKSNIQNLRYSNLSVSLAKAQRILVFAITAILLVTFLMICNNYLDINKSAKYLSQLVGNPGHYTASTTYSSKRKH